MLIERTIFKAIQEKLGAGKAVLVLGPRQTGKSTLLREIAKNADGPTLWLDCDFPQTRNELAKITSRSQMQDLLGNARLVLIDEAQMVRDIGMVLKIITDHFKEVQLVASGSSAFELSNLINEPLTGRKWEYLLLPMSTGEMVQHHGRLEESTHLHRRMVYGMYPEVVSNPGNEREVLKLLSTSYLYKDIFAFQDVRKPEVVEKLLQVLALQVGSESSFHGLSEMVGVDHATIQRYLDLLEKTFIVFRQTGFSRNLRTELKRTRKIYFYDNGIRNALLGAFQPINLRTDIGALWENFMVSERVKCNAYHRFYGNRYFWRTTEQQEIDYLEEYDGRLFAYEFKWNTNKPARAPRTFLNAYPEASFQTIHPENYLDEFLRAPASGANPASPL